MSGYISPKWILTEFFRRRLTDPRSTRTYTSNSTTIAASGDKAFSITPSTGTKVSYITSVTVDGTPVTKWQDYWIDYHNERVVFFSNQTGSVVINFYESSEDWIYPDKAVKRLSATKWPRININSTPAGANRLGQYTAPIQSVFRVTVHIWTKEKQDNQIFTISQGDPYGDLTLSGEFLAEYLGFQVLKTITDHESDLHPVLTDIQSLGPPMDLPYSDEHQCHHTTVEFLIQGVNLGEIE